MAKPYNYHLNHWRKAIIDNRCKCLLYHDTACDTDHKTRDCPILKRIGLKFEKQTDADNASQVVADALDSSPSPAPPPPTLGTLPLDTSGSSSTPGTFTASTALDLYDSGKEFDYEGKWDSMFYVSSSKSSKSDVYLGLSPSGCHVSTGPCPENGGSIQPQDPSISFAGNAICDAPQHPSTSSAVSAHFPSPPNPKKVCTVCLPEIVLVLLNNPAMHSISFHNARTHPRTSLLVADTGATNHMIPDKSAFISYYPVSGCQIYMSNSSFATILGHGSAIISLNGKMILIRHCLHVQDLCNPLYSLQAYKRQQGCGYIRMYGLGMYVFFPMFILEVDIATNCHHQYEPIDHQISLDQLDYVQPKCSQVQSATMATDPLDLPDIIEPDDEDIKEDGGNAPIYTSHWQKKPPASPTPTFNLTKLSPPAYFIKLKDLDQDALIQQLYTLEKPTQAYTQTPDSMAKIATHLHQPGLSLPPIRPCNTHNASKARSHWMLEEPHCITGCHCFWNHNYLLLVTVVGRLDMYRTKVLLYRTMVLLAHLTKVRC